MTTYGIREFKAKVSEVLREVQNGGEIIITRRGKPCGKLTPMPPPTPKSSLKALRELGLRLPDATWEDFQEIKKIWEPRVPDDL